MVYAKGREGCRAVTHGFPGTSGWKMPSVAESTAVYKSRGPNPTPRDDSQGAPSGAVSRRREKS